MLCRHDLLPFLIESEGICLQYWCVFFKSFETNTALSVDLHFEQLLGIVLSDGNPRFFRLLLIKH